MKNKNFQSRVCVCTASTNLLCTIKPCRNGEKNAGSENDIIGSIYYNLYSAGYISIDAGRKIGRFRRDQRCGGDLLGKEQRAFHGRNAGKGHEVSGCRFHYLAVILNLNVF